MCSVNGGSDCNEKSVFEQETLDQRKKTIISEELVKPLNRLLTNFFGEFKMELGE